MDKRMNLSLRGLLLLGLLGCFLVSGCSVRVYGIPKEEWQQLTPAEQQRVREDYLERRRLEEERRLYEAKQRAYEAELKARQAREEEATQLPPVRMIHLPHSSSPPSRVPPPRQETLNAPATIRITLQGGTVYTAGQHRPYRPITMTLHQGQSKRVELVTTGGRKSYRVQLFGSYDGGVLRLSSGKSRVHDQQFPYQRQWYQGQRYQHIEVGGGVGLQDGELLVRSTDEAVTPSSRQTPPPRVPQPAPTSRSTTDIRNEMLRRREQQEAPCRDASGRLIKPGQAGECAGTNDTGSQQGHPTTPASDETRGKGQEKRPEGKDVKDECRQLGAGNKDKRPGCDENNGESNARER